MVVEYSTSTVFLPFLTALISITEANGKARVRVLRAQIPLCVPVVIQIQGENECEEEEQGLVLMGPSE